MRGAQPKLRSQDANVKIVTDARLRECNYGDLTQAPESRIAEERASRVEAPYPGGQSYAECASDVRAFLDELAQEFPGGTVLVIGHRATQYSSTGCAWLPLAEAVVATWKVAAGLDVRVAASLSAGDLGGDKPLVLVRDLAADLRGKLGAAVVTLVDRVNGTIAKAAALDSCRFRIRPMRGLDEYDLARDTTSLGESARGLVGLQVTVETARDCKVERAIHEREVKRIPEHGDASGQARMCDLDIARDWSSPTTMPGRYWREPCSIADVERDARALQG